MVLVVSIAVSALALLVVLVFVTIALVKLVHTNSLKRKAQSVPQGENTVILFTDIQGSSTLADANAEEYRGCLLLHNEVVRAQVIAAPHPTTNTAHGRLTTWAFLSGRHHGGVAGPGPCMRPPPASPPPPPPGF